MAGLFMRYVTWPMGAGDSIHYLKMAESPGTFVGSPWGFRIAVPYAAAFLSSVLGISLEGAFGLLQIGMFSAFLTLLFLWVQRDFKINTFVAGLTCLLFVFSYPGVYNLHNLVHIGLAEHLLVLIGCIAMYSGRFPLLVVVVAISCFVKESVGLLLVPSYLVFALVTEKWRVALLRTTELALVFLAVSLVLRSGILLFRGSGLGTYVPFYSWEYMRYVYHYWGGLGGAVSQIVLTFGPMWLLACAGFIIAPAKLKALTVLPILAILQIALATDVGRMVAVGVPVLLALSAILLSRIDRGYAALATASSCFHFLCLNHRVNATASLAGSALVTLVILWCSRSVLFGANHQVSESVPGGDQTKFDHESARPARSC